ncbi:MAG: restriction endonuclease subunit S [Phocaeicola dorei]|nr:restriction endonuclease subunit S [Parabacteroides distasonis]
MVTHYSTNPHTIKAKIRDLGEAYSTMSMSKEQLTANGNPCIFYGELFTIYGCVIDEVKSKTHIKKEVSTLSRGRDLLFPASTTVDALSLIVPSTLMEKDIILGGDMFAIKISQEYNPLYLSYYFNYIANKRLSKYAKGTTIIHLHYNEIANVVVELPSIEEQGKIIAAIQGYTTKLDIEEALLERILDLKQYLLRQMFI